ncbi:hypothetical protein DAPPUDRAFT_311166 [Daphnia pulex]|uniref:Metalloendopeptidase n=1 Tax=Daphnia pulex TaxID=6669 RepID=E9FUV5_DAPPU|nr:hypothetical protein DAPPUDRAFT_311166 [Daphnia pulex]|eukprot:EFX88792.1 hypothetical protein DAPPUDRAFT_311166 [Daphnia pulex]
MLPISFVTLLLIAIIYYGKVTLSAPMPGNDNDLIDDTLIKFDSSNDPIGEIPGEALSPADFQNAELLVLEPLSQDSADVSSRMGGQNGLFEGDIVGVLNRETAAVTGRQKLGTKMHNAVVDVTLTWPSGTIPYVLSASFGRYERSVIAKAILEFHNQTCIRFVPRTNQDDYLNIQSGNGCSSNVGRAGGEQQVSLGMGCIYVGIVMHELMHAVGFWHEQSRTDRDDYVTIHWRNIIQGMAFNFQKHDQGRIQYLGQPYDTGSIMHYDAYAFAKDRRYPTITSNKNDDQQLGQRQGFSNSDVLKLNRLYQCETNSTWSTIPPLVTTTDSPLAENATVKSGCLDEHKYCNIWAKRGECERNPWMMSHCRPSCNQCDGECANLNDNCIRWAKGGECQKNEEYMKIYCRKSCLFCNDSTSAAATSANSECVDDDHYCPVWAAEGTCKANPGFMLLHCRKSCGEC